MVWLLYLLSPSAPPNYLTCVTALDDVKKSFSIAEVEHFESGKFLPEFAAAFLDERLIDRYDQMLARSKCQTKRKFCLLVQIFLSSGFFPWNFIIMHITSFIIYTPLLFISGWIQHSLRIFKSWIFFIINANDYTNAAIIPNANKTHVRINRLSKHSFLLNSLDSQTVWL